MEFRLLGRVEAIGNSGPLELGRRRERGVLAILLLEVGQPVSVDRLIELLFDDDPPRDPRKAIQIDISRLRRSLAEAADEDDVRLTSDQSGYALHTDPESVDVHRFTALVKTARTTDDPAERADLLRSALDLWRGQALADLAPGPSAEPIRARFEEMRLAAIELRVETDLLLGRHAELVPELADLTAQHPTSERLVAAQMLALYRSGRKRDALDVYQRTAGHLAEELGLDPGPRLTETHVAILRDDADLAAPSSPASTRPAPIRPAQLPADLPTFTGRDDELSSLLARCRLPREAATICAIDGMAGIGKTTLALRAAHLLSGDYPDGQLFIDLHGFTKGVDPVPAGTALGRLLRALGVPDAQIPTEIDDRAALYRSVLADRRVLVLLDNTTTEAQVRPLLPASAGCLALVTSRGRLAGLDESSPMSLDVLPLADADALFAEIAGPSRLADEPRRLVEEIVELCGRLPLAIRIAAARLRTRSAWSLAHLLERLRDEHHRLAELEIGERDIASAFQLSYRQLAPAHARMFRLLGLHHGLDIDIRAAAALADHGAREADQILDDLLDTHLLQQRQPGRYLFHDLLRAYATDRVVVEESEADRAAAQHRLIDHYASCASTAAEIVYPYEANRRPDVPSSGLVDASLEDRPTAAAWLDAELDNLLAIAAAGPAPHTIHLSAVLCRHLDTRGRYADDETLHRQALRSAQAIDDSTGQVRALVGLGQVDDMLGRHAQAADNYRRGLDLARASHDRMGEMDALIGLGRANHIQGPLAPAANYYRQGLELARELDDYVGTLNALAGLGHIHTMQGRLAEAAECFESGLQMARRAGDRIGQLTKVHGLAKVRVEMGQPDAAIDHYEQALDLAHETGSAIGEIRALNGMAGAHRVRGAYDESMRFHRRVLDLAGQIGDRNFQYEALRGLGEALLLSGNSTDARPWLQQALDLALELDQRFDQAAAHDGLGEVLHRLGEYEGAREHWTQAYEIFADLEVPNAEQVRDRLDRLDRAARA